MTINHESMGGNVLAYLQENCHKKHRSDWLAKTFGVSQANMKIILARLGGNIEFASDGHRMMYFVPSPEMIAQRAIEAGRPRRTHAKPLVQSQAMTDALLRCRELYPNGGNFKSIS